MIDNIPAVKDYIRKSMQESLDGMLNNTFPVNKYWEYIGKLTIAKQLLGHMGAKVRVNVMVEDEGL